MREIMLIFGGEGDEGDGDDQHDQVNSLWVEVDIINDNDGDDYDDEEDGDDDVVDDDDDGDCWVRQVGIKDSPENGGRV